METVNDILNNLFMGNLDIENEVEIYSSVKQDNLTLEEKENLDWYTNVSSCDLVDGKLMINLEDEEEED